MKTYEIKRMEKGSDWSDKPVIDIDTPYLDTPDTVKAWAQLAYDDEAILVRLWTEEYQHRATEVGPVGKPYEDCCLEFFFSPMENDGRYFNFENNAIGCCFLGIGSGLSDLVRLIPDTDEDLFDRSVAHFEGGWEIEYRFPYSFIKRFFPDFTVYKGKKIRANCFKCADLTEPPHYLSWSPVTEENFTFHKPECFGEMIFN